jgi:hypothetical protein
VVFLELDVMVVVIQPASVMPVQVLDILMDHLPAMELALLAQLAVVLVSILPHGLDQIVKFRFVLVLQIIHYA